jgi:hypothetical protein
MRDQAKQVYLRKPAFCLLAGMLLVVVVTHGQSVDSVSGKVFGFPSRLFGRIQSKTANLDQQLTSQTAKYLQRSARQEEKLKKKLYKVDSTGAKNLFATSAQQYAALEQKIRTDTGRGAIPLRGPYMSYVDSLQTSLAFLQKTPQIVGSSADIQKQLQGSASQFQQLQAKMQDAGQVQQFLQQRKAQIGDYLRQYSQLPSGITSSFADYKKQAYYYSQQVQSYKEELNDPDKLLKTGLQVLNRLPAFTSFVQKNSMLASLLNVPSTPGSPASAIPGQGMPGRDQVLSVIQGAAGPNSQNVTAAMQQNIQSAQGEVDQLRNKIAGLGSSGGSDLEVPDFNPNDQKTRSFLRRLQVGTNLQSTHSSFLYPTTTDIGLSLGYKINSKNIIGVGASYKIGWGSDIQHIRISEQGVGLRSFLDIQIKKTWYASGGFEYNYQQPFAIQGIPRDLDSWQKSGLIGISKIISMKTRVFKNTKIQLLWDFLSYQQVPRSQPLKFRIGYSF